MAECIIELENVSFSAQNDDVVKNISLGIEEGKATALVGPSGSGKSTVLKLAAGLLLPSGGEVRFRGKNISGMNRRENLDFRKEGAVVFQDSALWANQSLYQILELPLWIHFSEMTKAQRDRRIAETVAEAGYRRDLSRRPAMLSTGEQKIIAFARAMICRPSLWYLDEWTESLDDDAATRLISIVRQRKRDAHTIVFVSHDLRIIKSLADYVIIIVEGQISRKFTGEEIAADDRVEKSLEREITA